MFVSTTPGGTLARQLMPRRGFLSHSWLYHALLIFGGSLFVALCAQIRFPLPFTPVPITAQTLGVLLVGSLLGGYAGAGSMLLYLTMALVGLPFFTGGGAGIEHLYGATGGYLVAFPLAALVVGRLAERGWDRRVPTTVLSMLIGNGIIYLLGVAWLAAFVGVQTAILTGMLPFIAGDIIKIVIGCVVLPGGWRLIKKPR